MSNVIQFPVKNIIQEEIPSIEDFNILMDMMAQEEKNTELVEYELDGLGITKSGKVVFTDIETINYQKALRKQKTNL